jgi:protein-tyrosine phosphatase
MAEGIMRHEWNNLGFDGLAASSMGIHGVDNQEPSSIVVDICKEHRIDISAHRSRKLFLPELESADLILGMEKVHREFLHLFFPSLDDKNFLLGAWPEDETRKSAIKDPMNSSPKVFREIFLLIQSHITRIIPIIKELYH